MRIVATAGHVDHGKSTLVRALTGIDPDRWTEEKWRGLTIDLGFAATDLPSGRVAFIDVPGHERFLSNMLSGVGAVDAVLFVVSAVEGWKAQSEEHLSIVEVLGIAHGLVALTHADRVDHRRRDEVEAQIRARLAGGPLATAEVVATAATAGAGLKELTAALDRLVRTTPAAADHGRPRLWADRAFTIRGAGTIVTGTLAGGVLSVGQTLVTAPGDRPSRVRTIQVHDQSVDSAAPGHRVALNVPELTPGEVRRGVALVEPDRWHPTTFIDATLTVLASASHPISRRGAPLLHTGTGSWAVRLQVLHQRSIPPGSHGHIRVQLPEPVPLRPGDRYVLRDTGSDSTVGGGTVLELDPISTPRHARPALGWERVVEEHGWIEARQLERLTGAIRRPTLGRWVVSDAAQATALADLRRAITTAGPSGIRRSALDERTRALVEGGLDPEIVLKADYLGLAETDEALGRHPWLGRLAAELFSPTPPDGVPASEVEALVRRGLVVRRDGIHFHFWAIPEAVDRLRALASAQTDGFTVSDARRALGTTRKFTLPVLVELDTRGLTRRHGDLRTVVQDPPSDI